MDKEREIAKLAELINDRVGTNLGQIHGTKSGFGKSADITTTVDTKLVAKAIIEAGYGDMKQAVREFAEKVKERWTKNMYHIYLRDIDELLAEVTGE